MQIHAQHELTPFGDLLGRMRRARRLSQEDVALKMGCARTFISQLERNIKKPNSAQLIRLACALGLSGEESAALTEAATICNGILPLPDSMPLPVRQELLRLTRFHEEPSLGSWAALKRALARIAPVSK